MLDEQKHRHKTNDEMLAQQRLLIEQDNRRWYWGRLTSVLMFTAALTLSTFLLLQGFPITGVCTLVTALLVGGASAYGQLKDSCSTSTK